MSQKQLMPFIVRYVCPFCDLQGEIIVVASSRKKAASKALGTPIICPRCGGGFILKHEYMRGVFPLKLIEVPKRTAEVKIESAKRFPDDTVAVTLRFLRGEFPNIFPRSEVKVFDRLMRVVKAAGEEKIKLAVLAVLIAHGAGTRSLITGFLLANGYKTDISTVGEALSRHASEGYIYRDGSYLGETVYIMPEETRLRIIERLKFEPYLEWYKPQMLKPTPPLKFVRRKVEYEWVKFIKPSPRFRSAEDYKYYGPYREGEIVKLPLLLAYFLVRTGYAEWLNPKKETVAEAEEIFKFETIPKIRRQAVLTEFYEEEKEEEEKEEGG